MCHFTAKKRNRLVGMTPVVLPALTCLNRYDAADADVPPLRLAVVAVGDEVLVAGRGEVLQGRGQLGCGQVRVERLEGRLQT